MQKQFTSTEAGRLDKVIADHTKLSRKRARKLVEGGGVSINGQRVRFSSQAVPAGAVIRLQTAAEPTPEFQMEVCFQDEALMILNKPCGLPSQATKEGNRTHLYGHLTSKFPYVGLHHRLDTPASGLVLFTLHKRFNKPIAEAFRTHSIGRNYQVVVVGHPGESGTWDAPIGDKTARTHFKTLGSAQGMSLIEASLETGRTHQIRIHAAEAGHPIVGDRRHGGSAGGLWPRLALHAAQLKFKHPASGEAITVSAPIPADLQGLWERFAPQCSPDSEAD
jgi:23S rRNA pseudouridine1911/1915/1917 synthase